MSLPEDDLINPPASRPTWGTLVYALAFAFGAFVLLHWPEISHAIGL